MTQPNILGSMTLKALLEDPNLQNPPLIAQSDHLKIKKEDDSGPQFNYGSAFLGPNLWNKTYNDPNFNLEYMDLDEFLSENGLPIVADDALADLANGGDSPAGQNPCLSPPIVNPSLTSSPIVNPSLTSPPHVNPSQSPRQFLKTPPLSPTQFTSPAVSVPAVSSTLSPILPPYSPQNNKSRSPSPPVSPFKVDFQVSEQDLALTAVPDYKESAYQLIRQPWSSPTAGALGKSGHDNFDPRKRNFTDEELKPQPIIKKSKKVFVPDDLKDDKYWARRHKNNFAAKRSRDARRVKENQIAMRASFLEKENDCLKKEMAKLKKENAKLLLTVAKYEGRDLGSTL